MAVGSGVGEPALGQANDRATLVPPRPVFQDFYGYAVGAADDAAVVGEMNDDDGDITNVGAVWIYPRSAAGWGEPTRILQPEGRKADQFGSALALEGHDLAVGAWSRRIGTERLAGAVYLYDRQGGDCRLTQVLTSPFATFNQRFGVTLDLSGDRLLVGATGYAKPRGAAFLYERAAGSDWELKHLFFPYEHATDLPALPVAAAGYDVAVDGTVAVVGSYMGGVFVYERNTAGTWDSVARLLDPTPNNDDNFGQAVDVEGDWIVVGEPVDQQAWAPRPGSVFLYRRSTTGSWEFHAEVQASDKAAKDVFGYSVDLQDSWLLVGAPHAETDNVVTGAAYLLEFDSSLGEWVERQRWSGRTDQNKDFGGAVSLCQSYGVVGDPIGRIGDLGCGLAYVFDRPLGEVSCDSLPNSTGATASLTATGSILAEVGALRLRAVGLPRGEPGFFLAGRSEAYVPHPGGSDGVLCVGAPSGRLGVGGLTSDGLGELTARVDASCVPQGSGCAPILAGETWWFQAWFRDSAPGYTANTSQAVRVTFR